MNRRMRRLTLFILPLVLGPLLAWSVLSVLAGNQTVPLKGTFSGAGDHFSGTATHLGRFDGIIDQTALTAVWVGANGDTITNQTTHFEITDCPAADRCNYVQKLAITGGSGRFAYAGGSATVSGSMNPVEGGEYDGRIEGTITWEELDDTKLAARISAPIHPLDVDGDGVNELFKFDIAASADDDEARGALGGLQITDGKTLNNFTVMSGSVDCDPDFKRPVLEMISTKITSQRGNRGEVEVQPDMALSVSPVSVGSGVNNALVWTLNFTDTVPAPSLSAVAIGDNLDSTGTLSFTETWPFEGGFFIDPCTVIPGPD